MVGHTTAAAVWAAAAVGVLAGAGSYLPAIAGTALAVLILELDKIPGIRRVEPRRLREDQGEPPAAHED